MPYHDITVLNTRNICTRSHFGWKSPRWTVLEMSSPNFPAFRNVSLFFLPSLQSALAGSKAGRCHLRSDAGVWIEQMCPVIVVVGVPDHKADMAASPRSRPCALWSTMSWSNDQYECSLQFWQLSLPCQNPKPDAIRPPAPLLTDLFLVSILIFGWMP